MIAGSGYRGISSGSRKRPPTTSTNTKSSTGVSLTYGGPRGVTFFGPSRFPTVRRLWLLLPLVVAVVLSARRRRVGERPAAAAPRGPLAGRPAGPGGDRARAQPRLQARRPTPRPTTAAGFQARDARLARAARLQRRPGRHAVGRAHPGRARPGRPDVRRQGAARPRPARRRGTSGSQLDMHQDQWHETVRRRGRARLGAAPAGAVRRDCRR